MASTHPELDPKDMSQRMKDSAQHIWLAGLGAFAKAQEEGTKVFENLVKEGSHLQQTTQQAQAKMTEAAEKVCQSTNLITYATSLGGVETLMERRRRWPSENVAVPENLIRMSVGIENPNDIWADLDQALLSSGSVNQQTQPKIGY